MTRRRPVRTVRPSPPLFDAAPDLAALIARAKSIQIQPADLIVIDVDEHLSDETIAGQRYRTILVLPRLPLVKGPRR